MRRSAILALAVSLPLWSQTFRAGEPGLTDRNGLVRPLTLADYEKFAAGMRGRADFVAIAKLPPTLGPDYRLGYNFFYEHANHGWILDQDADGYVLYLDRKGDGDLRASEPLRFFDRGGVQRLDVAMVDSEARWTARFEVAKGTEGNIVRISGSSARSGVVKLDGHIIPFQLSGSGGWYDSVSFDREGNRKFESYKPSDKLVNLAGKPYAFHIDPHGSFLKLTASDTRGTLAPDVSLTDLAGKTHGFRNGSSELTLIEFWDTSCGPCRQEMPLLKKLHDQLPRERFDILGVTSDRSRETLRKYLAELSIAWPECLEPDNGPVHQVMRIDGIPAYFLVAKEGEIIDQWVGSGDSVKRIQAALRILR